MYLYVSHDDSHGQLNLSIRIDVILPSSSPPNHQRS